MATSKHMDKPTPEHLPLILVVDDNPDALRILRLTFEPSYRIISAASGEEGIQQAVTLKPDLILTDVSMQGMAGDQMIREIRQRPGLEKVPIIVMTGLLDRQTRERIEAVQPNDCFRKPFSMTELLASVDNCLHQAALGGATHPEVP